MWINDDLIYFTKNYVSLYKGVGGGEGCQFIVCFFYILFAAMNFASLHFWSFEDRCKEEESDRALW